MEFLDKEGLEQQRGDHPFALEVYCGFTLDHELTVRTQEYRIVVEGLKKAITDIYPEIHPNILEFVEFGLETAEVDEPQEIEAKKRISYDGESFKEHDISYFMKGFIRDRI